MRLFEEPKISFPVGDTEYFSCFHSKEFIKTFRFVNLNRNNSAYRVAKVRDLLGPNFGCLKNRPRDVATPVLNVMNVLRG